MCKHLLPALAALALVAACGSSGRNSLSPTTTGAPQRSTAAGSAGQQTTTADPTQIVLGDRNPASGDPVKVGLIMNGAGAGFDTTIDEPVAKAAFAWINERRGGIGGRPVQLDTCQDHQVPSEASDCAAQMVRDGVVAVVYGANGQFEASWRPLHEAGIPTYILIAGGSEAAASDPDNTFELTDSLAPTVVGPIALAKKLGTTKVSVVAVDVPAATSVYREGAGPGAFKQAGIDLNLIPVALGQPDMTPEMIELVKKNSDGVVLILGTDAFCLAALNGLQTAGFKGAIAANEACIGDSTRKSIPGTMLKGIRTHVAVPLGDDASPSVKLFKAVLETYGHGIKPDAEGASVFLSITALDTATQRLTGPVTAQSVTAATKGMDWLELPGSGGRHFRCDGKADPTRPAVCSEAVLFGVLDATGHPSTFEVVGDDPIG